METKYPRVGLGIIIVNKDGNILIGKRKGSHAQKYSIPWGHLDLGETFEEGAIREIKEETNLDIFEPKVIAISNNLETYKEEGKHHISVFFTYNKIFWRIEKYGTRKMRRMELGESKRTSSATF